MNVIQIDSTDSTNSWMAENESSIPSPSLVFCNRQTAGRGQRGNSWESAPGENITASLIFHPMDFPASRQFSISEAISLAIVEFLQDLGVVAMVKWPNDIYVGDRKICGILVENVVMEKTISRCIAGFGININQKRFLSDAPNPVSLSLLTGIDFDVPLLVEKLAFILDKYLGLLGSRDMLHQKFLRNLWRRDGNFYNFYDKVKNEPLKAYIHDVSPEGYITLITNEGESRDFAFKEVEYVINHGIVKP